MRTPAFEHQQHRTQRQQTGQQTGERRRPDVLPGNGGETADIEQDGQSQRQQGSAAQGVMKPQVLFGQTQRLHHITHVRIALGHELLKAFGIGIDHTEATPRHE
mgnify:CR=1 FL=1